MSVDSRFEGGFGGTRREGIIHYRLFTLLSGYDGHFKHRGGYVSNYTENGLIFSWLTDVKGWNVNSDGWIFASLAKALPEAEFNYHTFMMVESGSPDESICDIEFKKGALSFCSLERRVVEPDWDEDEDDEDDEDDDDFDDDFEEEYEEDEWSLNCNIDNDGNIVDDKELSSECLKSEKECLSELLSLIEAETADTTRLMDIGMLYETGLAGVDRNLPKAWDCYLRAAQTGDQKAIEFIREIFSDDNRKALRELLKSKCIRKEYYQVFFDLGARMHNAELTADLLDYKNSL